MFVDISSTPLFMSVSVREWEAEGKMRKSKTDIIKNLFWKYIYYTHQITYITRTHTHTHTNTDILNYTQRETHLHTHSNKHQQKHTHITTHPHTLVYMFCNKYKKYWLNYLHQTKDALFYLLCPWLICMY